MYILHPSSLGKGCPARRQQGIFLHRLATDRGNLAQQGCLPVKPGGVLLSIPAEHVSDPRTSHHQPQRLEQRPLWLRLAAAVTAEVGPWKLPGELLGEFFRASRVQADNSEVSQNNAEVTSMQRGTGEREKAEKSRAQPPGWFCSRSVWKQLSFRRETETMLQWKQPLWGQPTDKEPSREARAVLLGARDAGAPLPSKLDLREEPHAKSYPDSESSIRLVPVSSNSQDMAADIISCCLLI